MILFSRSLALAETGTDALVRAVIADALDMPLQDRNLFGDIRGQLTGEVIGLQQPVVASSINEARELAESDLRQRLQKLDRGQEAVICPARYTLWARGFDGQYCGGLGCGAVYKISPTGQKTVLYSFTGGLDGEGPYGSLTRGVEGNIYGTTSYGGGPTFNAAGTVFKLDGSGNENGPLYVF